MSAFSFEVFPPRSPAARDALHAALDELVAAHPEFISVTYGANGSSREASLELLRHLEAIPGATPMAHLTCVGSTFAEASRLIREFLDAGITNFLALRGDPPAGVPDDEIDLGELGSAAELVQLIHRVRRERAGFAQHDAHGFREDAEFDRGTPVTIGVATFPNGHPRSRSRTQDIDTLLAKEAAGANLAITQLFFEPDDYLGFVDEARAAGVTMRILPGIMPVLSVARLHRMLELSGEDVPRRLLAELEATPDEESAARVGIDACIRLTRALVDGGAPGIHLYTFNRADAPLAVLRGAGLLTSRGTS